MRPGTTRPSLLLRLRDPRDAEAWRTFDAHYRPLILAFCRSQGLQTFDGDDVCQTVLASVAGAMRGGFALRPERGRFRDYLGRAARNAIVAQRRRGDAAASGEARRAMVDADAAANTSAPAGGGALADAWESEWRRSHLRRALAALRERASARDVAILDRLLQGATIESVAAESRMSAAAVHKVKQRLRDKLRRQVLEQVRDEDLGDEP